MASCHSRAGGDGPGSREPRAQALGGRLCSSARPGEPVTALRRPGRPLGAQPQPSSGRLLDWDPQPREPQLGAGTTTWDPQTLGGGRRDRGASPGPSARPSSRSHDTAASLKIRGWGREGPSVIRLSSCLSGCHGNPGIPGPHRGGLPAPGARRLEERRTPGPGGGRGRLGGRGVRGVGGGGWGTGTRGAGSARPPWALAPALSAQPQNRTGPEAWQAEPGARTGQRVRSGWLGRASDADSSAGAPRSSNVRRCEGRDPPLLPSPNRPGPGLGVLVTTRITCRRPSPSAHRLLREI